MCCCCSVVKISKKHKFNLYLFPHIVKDQIIHSTGLPSTANEIIQKGTKFTSNSRDLQTRTFQIYPISMADSLTNQLSGLSTNEHNPQSQPQQEHDLTSELVDFDENPFNPLTLPQEDAEFGKEPIDITSQVKLFVGQVPKSMDEEGLYHVFADFGPIADLTIIRDKVSNMHKGCALVTYCDEESADRARGEVIVIVIVIVIAQLNSTQLNSITLTQSI